MRYYIYILIILLYSCDRLQEKIDALPYDFSISEGWSYFEDGHFDFVFCNGTIHHSRSILQSLEELKRVLKKEGKAFVYIYAKNGIFWDTRVAMRQLFKKIPLGYTQKVLDLIVCYLFVHVNSHFL